MTAFTQDSHLCTENSIPGGFGPEFWEERVRHHRLFAAGLAAALMLGAASPAMAKSNNGKGHGKDNAPGHTKPHPNKGGKAGVSGGGSIGTAEFSIQARTNHLKNGHFNYTVADDPATTTVDETYKLRCRDFSAAGVYSSTVPTVTLTGATCSLTTVVNGVPATQTVTINATFTDNGQPKSAKKDSASFFVNPDTVNQVGGDLTGGNIKVR